MIKSIQIQNFKSVVDLQLDLGSFNVLIGENGCGKSNILEGIAFGAAANADKLDFEFLGSRGIRLANPEFMYSAFEDIKKHNSIDIQIKDETRDFNYKMLNNNNLNYWGRLNTSLTSSLPRYITMSLRLSLEKLSKKEVEKSNTDLTKKIIDSLKPYEIQDLEKIEILIKNFINKAKNESDYDEIERELEKILLNKGISKFVIFTPEESKIRKLEDTNQIYPLGIKGEGLFQYLKELMKDEKNAGIINEIKENLGLLDWYEDFALPNNMMQNEYGLSVKDRYLHENLSFFDQRSTNEGFLFLLFYATLFISKDTPQFFAIDNIDASFNPKLCMKLVRNLAALAKKHNKQVIVTTHNPAVLDGLNLNDDDQRLFVVRRNEEGHTKAKRVEHKAERTMKLSEIWTNGFIGGLPENF
jgi:predicted ATPase